MKILITSPSKAIIQEYTQEELDRLYKDLTYSNTAAAHDLKRLSNNFWFRNKNKDKWEQAMNEAKAKVKRTLVFEDEKGLYIRPGSIPYLSNAGIEVVNEIQYPKPKVIPWEKPIPILYPYQEESWKKLLYIKHGNVELCTGAGKTLCAVKLCRETGFRTVVVVPSKSIFNELLKKFEYHFGKGKVGAFGAGKKKLGKLFTIAIGDSLTNIEPNTKEWDFFSNLEMLIVDEAHAWGAETLEKVCFDVVASIPYRFFFSGTQIRTDGGLKLLQSIIGKTVHTLSTKQAVEGGYICAHDYRIIGLESSNPNFSSQDVLEMKRVHYLKNRNICAFIAKLCNTTAASKVQTLVLVEELEQISMLCKLLKVPFAYAHSEKKAERLLELELTKVDPDESVEKFNKGEISVLIGTSCIATGTNIYPCHNTVNWAGGASEIRTKQGPSGDQFGLDIRILGLISVNSKQNQLFMILMCWIAT
jgi:superfamily II DNA or RNA helicase